MKKKESISVKDKTNSHRMVGEQTLRYGFAFCPGPCPPAGLFPPKSTVLGVPFQACSTDYAIGYASVCWAVILLPSAIRC